MDSRSRSTAGSDAEQRAHFSSNRDFCKSSTIRATGYSLVAGLDRRRLTVRGDPQASAAEGIDRLALLCGRQHRSLPLLQSPVVNFTFTFPRLLEHSVHVPGLLAPVVNAGFISVSYFILLSGFVLGYNYNERARARRVRPQALLGGALHAHLSHLLSQPAAEPGAAQQSNIRRTPTPCSGRGWC